MSSNDLSHLSSRDRELILLALHIETKGVTKLPHRRNKDFSRYLTASRRSSSLARGLSKAKRGKAARSGFDLNMVRALEVAGEE